MKSLILIAILFFTQAQAADWVPVGSPSNIDRYQIDKNSVANVSGSIWKAWHRVLYAKPSTNRNFMSLMALVEVDCVNSTSRGISFVTYNSEGEPVGRSQDTTAQFDPIIPDSIGESVKEAICTQALVQGFGEWLKTHPSK